MTPGCTKAYATTVGTCSWYQYLLKVYIYIYFNEILMQIQEMHTG